MATIDSYNQQVDTERVSRTEAPERIQFGLAQINANDGIALEQMTGETDLSGIDIPEISLRVARSVCKIDMRDQTGNVLGTGTGFLVSPTLLLTHHHVLESVEGSRHSLARFNFQDGEKGVSSEVKIFALEPERYFLTDAKLDLTLVAVSPMATDTQTPLSAFGYIPLREPLG